MLIFNTCSVKLAKILLNLPKKRHRPLLNLFIDLRKYLYIIFLILCTQVAILNGQYNPVDAGADEVDQSTESTGPLGPSEELLLQAADEGDTSKIKVFLKLGVNPNIKTWDRYTPLMLASQHGFTNAGSILLAAGAKLNERSEQGYTALILAVANGFIETAEMLIRNGADVNLGDINNVTPLMHAISVDTFYMPDMLLYYEAQVNLSNSKDQTALMLAANYGLYEISARLLESGAEINAVDEKGNSPLHYAIAAGKKSVAELLLLNGADVDARNSSGYTPLAVAVAKRNYAASKLLIGYGADVNVRIDPAFNILSFVMNDKNDSIRNLLLNNNAVVLRKPNINQFTLGATVRFNDDDTHTGMSFGISESRYHLMADMEYAFRLKAVQVLDRQDANTSYQFWERRHFVTLTLGKGFLNQNFGSNVSARAYASVSQTLTFGGYKGSEKNPGLQTVFNPRIGCMFDLARFRLKFGYEWMNLDMKGYNENWFGISIEYLINRKRGLNRIPEL